MSLNRLHVMIIGVWIVALATLVGVRLFAGIPITLTESVAVVLLGSIPPFVMLAIFRGAGPRNVTQMLYEVNGTARETVPVHATGNDTGRGIQ